MAEQQFPWRAGAATGVGSMPGTDPAQACRVVFDELPDLPYLPELPGRGPGADLTGRTAALLVDLPVQLTPTGWKLTDRPGRDLTRAVSYWSLDLDTLEEVAAGYAGPLKIQVCGPWTLAATLELSRSANPALSDPGAVADLTASLAEGVAAHAADVRKRVPGATVVVQLDEPCLPTALAGQIPTASGLATVAPVDRIVASQRLATVLAAPSAPTVVHCCGRAAAAFDEIRAAGATSISFDLGQLPVRETDRIAELAEAGLGLLVGAVPTDVGPATPRQTARDVVAMWRRTGLAADQLPAQVVITPACGLAGIAPAAATAALRHCREAARVAAEMIEESSR
ncbi:MAG TPA: methionine synthase [Streptosporangiaceae bacterium]|nr:methionine synthase [Streptosporangiaceae bacterium]